MSQDPLEPIELTRVMTEFEAATITEALHAAGVLASVLGGNLAGMRAEAPAMATVVVRRMDLDKARDILRAVKADSIDIDWNEVDIGQPETADLPALCPHCRYPRSHIPDARPCPECGRSPLAAPSLIPLAAPYQSPPVAKRLWLLLLIFPALILIAAIVAFKLQQLGSK